MLALLGALTVVVLLTVIMLNLLSPLVALIAVPIVAALIGGFGLATSKFILTGISGIAPVAGMFVFAILYFGIMTDAGMLDPIIDRILRAVGSRPTRIVVGTALLALLIHLDGSGAVCFLVTIPAMLPLYEKLGMDRRVLACAASMAAGVNFLPWTGPTLRASAALKIPVTDIFQPMIGVQVVGLIYVFVVAWLLGKREERRLGLGGSGAVAHDFDRALTPEEAALRRPRLFLVNLLLTVIIMAVMIGGWVDPVVMFMIGVVLALTINYPNVAEQRKRIDAHSKAALLMAGILLAAGAFTGIMTGTGMLKALATAAVSVVPDSMGHRDPVRARAALDAAQPVVRSRQLLLRRASGRRRSDERARRPADPGGAGGAARPDDDWISGQPADTRDVPGGRSGRHRPRRAPALLHPVPVRRLGADDDRRRRFRSAAAVKGARE